MNNLASILLMMGQQGQEGQSPYGSFIFLGLIIVVFYFFMIRPQVKKQKEMKQFRSSLEKGDKVVTTGGIYGKIADIKDDSFTIEIDTNVKIKVAKSAVLKDFDETAKK